MRSFNVNYKKCTSQLCEIGKKYDTDKSPQRLNVSDKRHRHPYTLFYDGLFRHKKDCELNIAELGILNGGSLLMWREYFSNSHIYGFEYNQTLIDTFRNSFDNNRITLNNINVKNKNSIIDAFNNVNVMYDVIIEDTTHHFEDQLRVIYNVHKHLKPGGVLIIEDIFKNIDEKLYNKRLRPLLNHFQNYYFVSLDHVNKHSKGWNNDKLLVLVKGGGEPIFKNTNKITIITPSYRINNLKKVKNSINFYYVNEWIIVYDGKHIKDNPNLFEGQEAGKIKEYICESEGISGNPQRNFALSKLTNEDTIIYYLDDDNIIHPSIYMLLNFIDNTKMYTFNQHNRIKGNNIRVGAIDTAMVLIPYKLCKNISWVLHRYDADGVYIEECYKQNKDRHVFVDNVLCYYNKI
jgi:SAM-dependent methyltransferase